MQFRWAWLVLLLLIGGLTACSTLTGSSEIDALETQNAQYRGTIEVMGTPMLTIAALEQQAAQNVVLQAQLQAAQGTLTEMELHAAQATLTMVSSGGNPVVSQPDPNASSPRVTPGAVNTNQTPGFEPQATAAVPLTAAPGPADDNTTRFSQTVTSTGRDAQDCAVGVTALFEPTTPTIYVVTRVNLLNAGAVIGARWTANGELYFDDVECWVPQQSYTDICAYCSILPDGPAFDTGQWSVELLLNSQVLSEVQFQVRDPNATDEGVSAEATVTPAGWKGNN